MILDSKYRVYQYGPPAQPENLGDLAHHYTEIPKGYRSLVKEVTGLVLLWHDRGELRLWGPEEVVKMDAAYGVSAMIPGAMPLGDNGGGQILVYGHGLQGQGIYLVETGSLFLDEDAAWLADDVDVLLESAAGAETIFQSDPIDPSTLGAPIYAEGEYR